MFNWNCWRNQWVYKFHIDVSATTDLQAKIYRHNNNNYSTNSNDIGQQSQRKICAQCVVNELFWMNSIQLIEML